MICVSSGIAKFVGDGPNEFGSVNTTNQGSDKIVQNSGGNTKVYGANEDLDLTNASVLKEGELNMYQLNLSNQDFTELSSKLKVQITAYNPQTGSTSGKLTLPNGVEKEFNGLTGIQVNGTSAGAYLSIGKFDYNQTGINPADIKNAPNGTMEFNLGPQ
jgi:hypothetical protein